MSLARALIAEAESHGVTLSVRDGKVKLSSSGTPPADFLDRLRAAKPAIEAELLQRSKIEPDAPRRCAACGSPHAPFGTGWTLANPSAAKWFCGACRPLRSARS